MKHPITKQLTKQEQDEYIEVAEMFDFYCERHLKLLGNESDRMNVTKMLVFTEAMKEFNRIIAEDYK